jgi:hypothetical protein
VGGYVTTRLDKRALVWALFICSGLGFGACSGDTDTTDVSSSTDTDADTDGSTDPNDPGNTSDTSVESIAPPTGDPMTVDLNGTCELAKRWGSFRVEVNDFYSYVDGSISNGVVPVTVLRPELEEGECKLLKRDNPFCDPPCLPGETCDFDGSCITYPEPQDLGTVEVTGLVEDVLMNPVQPGWTYFDTTVPHPAWNPGDLIELRTGEGSFDPVTLHAVAVQPLEIPTDDWVVFDDEPLKVYWTPAEGEVRSHVHVKLDIDQHGLTPVNLFCEFEDDGEGEVPASLIAELVEFGVSGFPNATVTRRTTDSVPVGEGCVDFMATSPQTPTVRVDGYTPCNTDYDCPTGQTCNLAIQLCE